MRLAVLLLVAMLGCSVPAGEIARTMDAAIDGGLDAMLDGGPDDPSRPPQFVVVSQSERVVALNGDPGSEAFSDVSFATVLQYALDHLPAGGTSPETIAVRGRFVLSTTIRLPSYVQLDLSAAEGHAILYLNRVTDAEVRGTRFLRAQGHAVYLYKSKHVRVANIYIELCGSEGVKAWEGSDVSVVSSTFFNIKSSAIATATSPGSLIADNTVTGVRRDHAAISLNSVRTQVLKNRIEDGDGSGITIGH